MTKLKVAFLHYHLRAGGVTTVIKNQVAALQECCDTMVVASQIPGDAAAMGTDIAPVPLAAYDNEIHQDYTAADLAAGIMEAIKQKWPRGCDVLHVHNPTLAKNRKMPEALEILRDNGVAMFLQIHDFAEDGRPDVYYRRDYVADTHYGVINSRDYDILVDAGLKPAGLHMIENQVRPFETGDPTGKGLVLYPVRAIRRKNIGEALLLSLFLKNDVSIGVTLPPNSTADLEHYSRWQDFIEKHRFNVKLGVGLDNPFDQLVRDARFFITTSVNEGFGFAFLEPWTAGKMVAGRHLPHVCRDFKNRGVDLGHLYDTLAIPLSCMDRNAVHTTWRETQLRHARAFDFPLPTQKLVEAFQQISRDGFIDFGILDEHFQQQALAELKNGSNCLGAIRQHNPWLENLSRDGPGSSTRRTIEHNNGIIRKYYGKESYRQRLMEIYQKVTSAEVNHRIDKKNVMEAFFDPLLYKMLKWKSI